MTRRIQSVALILALLAAPLALLSRSYACTASPCAMMCCPAHKHSMKMNCSGPSGASACTMRCNSHKTIDYGLASPLPPTQLATDLSLPTPKLARLRFFAPRHPASSGFTFEPFKPPRA